MMSMTFLIPEKNHVIFQQREIDFKIVVIDEQEFSLRHFKQRR